MTIYPIFDLQYIEDRDKLIPLAASWANELVGDGKNLKFYSYEKWMADWTRTFSDKMQQLAMQRGLTCGMPREQEVLG